MKRSRRSFALLAAVAGPSLAIGLRAHPAAAPGGLLSELKSGAKTLVVGTDATFPPFEQTSPQGEKSGFDIELVKAITAKIGIGKLTFQQVPFGQLIPGLMANHIDLAASAIYITAAREKVVNFSQPYFKGGLSVMVKPDDTTIKEPSNLNGKRIAVQVGTKSVDYLKQNFPAAQLLVVQTNDQMFQALQSGRADAVVTGYPAARYYIKTHGGAKLADFLLTHEEYGLALRKEDPDLLKAVNDALDALKSDGTMTKLENQWFGSAA
jgi:glutamine transport system substrate-binding protein/glutamine transport system permease protein